MTVSTFSSREFNQATSRIQRAARKGPVYITDRGRPAFVLLTFAEYEGLTGGGRIVDMLGLPPGVEDIELDVPRLPDLPRPAEF